MTDQYRQDDPRHVHDYQPHTTPDGTQLQVCNGLNCEAKQAGCVWHTEPGELKPLIDDPGCGGGLNRIFHKDPSQICGTNTSVMCDTHITRLNDGVVLRRYPLGAESKTDYKRRALIQEAQQDRPAAESQEAYDEGGSWFEGY